MIMIDKKQQCILDKFFEEETTWFPEHVISKFVAYLLIGISSMTLLMPYDTMEFSKDIKMYIMLCMLYSVGINIYANIFSVYNERGIQKSLYELLRWMPVSLIQLKLYRLRKIIKICTISSIVLVIAKIIIAICRWKFFVFDFIMAVFACFILPVILHACSLLFPVK